MLLSTRLKNQLKGCGNYEFDLKNIRINGSNRGCCGFIKNLDNGVIVYVDTEPSCCSWIDLLHRYARDMKDYRGGTNKFSKEKDFANGVVKLLNDRASYELFLNGHI